MKKTGGQKSRDTLPLRHHSDIAIVKFRIKTDTWQVTDSRCVVVTLFGLSLKRYLRFIFGGQPEPEYLDANTSFERRLKRDDILAEFLVQP